VFHESFNSKNADHSQSFPPWPKTQAENLWGRTAGPNWPLWLGRQSKRMLDMAITTSQCSKNGNSSSGGKMFFLAKSKQKKSEFFVGHKKLSLTREIACRSGGCKRGGCHFLLFWL